MSAQLDHLVVAASSLDEGVQWCEATLGTTPGPGGRHPLMGTHNRLLNIGDDAFPQVFLEIIAIDPMASAPGRARWFGLDTLDLATGPRLLHFVARCSALDALSAKLRASGWELGATLAASRDTPQGRLEWRINVRDDGQLIARGALPTLMDWGRTPHPTLSMPASGIRLRSLTLRGLEPGVEQALALPRVEIAATPGPALSASLDTPRGRVTLVSG
ncbi:MAG: VOC family protein [Pseudomonadota bacterium]